MDRGKFSRRLSRARATVTGAAQDAAPPDGAPLGGTKAEATQRLQVGLAGLGSMVLLVALASIIGSQADLAEEAAVPDAAPTTEPTDIAPQSDPLADAGIVPEISAEPDDPVEVADLPAPAAQGADAPQDTDPVEDIGSDADAP